MRKLAAVAACLAGMLGVSGALAPAASADGQGIYCDGESIPQCWSGNGTSGAFVYGKAWANDNAENWLVQRLPICIDGYGHASSLVQWQSSPYGPLSDGPDCPFTWPNRIYDQQFYGRPIEIIQNVRSGLCMVAWTYGTLAQFACDHSGHEFVLWDDGWRSGYPAYISVLETDLNPDGFNTWWIVNAPAMNQQMVLEPYEYQWADCGNTVQGDPRACHWKLT